MKKTFKIAVLPGDGIGPEIIKEGLKIIEILKKKFFLKIETEEYLVGGAAIDKYNHPLPKTTLNGCKNSDAILFGSVGGPKWEKLPSKLQPERGALLPLRKHFNLFSNIRAAKLYPELKELSPLRSEITTNGFDILFVRELTGGIYFGKPKGRKCHQNNEYAFDTEIYHRFEIERIAKLAFELAKTRKFKVTSIDKANVLESSVLWRETVTSISKNYPNVHLSHLYVDNATMQLIKSPYEFDVILCSNLFGDILSDECAIITGSIGMLPSASINEKKFGLYEPAGGSAPDIQGKNLANPIAQILSIAMLLRYSMKLNHIAQLIEWSVKKALKKGYRTYDIAQGSKDYISTSEMGTIISELLSKGA